MRPGEAVFIDTGAWIALAAGADPWHERALQQWEILARTSVRLFTSVPVVIETFTFLDRKGSRDLALRWRESLREIHKFELLPCTLAILDTAWTDLDRKAGRALGLVDATSFALMRKHGIRQAFTFDYRFAAAGFVPVA